MVSRFNQLSPRAIAELHADVEEDGRLQLVISRQLG
jgi:hypothetical protein